MGAVGTGILRFGISIIGGIGSILLLIGVFPLFSGGDANIVIIGLFFSVLGEAGNIFMVRYEDKKQLDMFRLNFWNALGASYAFPIILLALYFMSYDKFTLILSMALAASAILRTAAMLVKMRYIENVGI